MALANQQFSIKCYICLPLDTHAAVPTVLCSTPIADFVRFELFVGNAKADADDDGDGLS